MDQEIIVQVCAGCGACEADIMAELAKLQHESGIPVRVEIEECLDTCDDEPSFAVNSVSIAPASPQKLRTAVEMARRQ
jgi:NADH:ubiquinone oxidoreductase subunit E